MEQDEVRKLREQLSKNQKTSEEISLFLKKIINKQKEIVQIISVLELFNEIVYLNHILFKKKKISDSLKYLDAETYSIMEAVNNIANNCRYYNIMEVKIKNNIENRVRKYKEYFEDLIDVLYGYYVEARYVNEVISDKSRDFFSEEFIDEKEFYQSVLDFITEVEEEKEQRIQEIISSVPFAMSKKRFYEYLAKGLEKDYPNYEAFLENLIDIEENFYGKLIEGYGKVFPLIANKIEYLQSLEFKEMTGEELDVYFKKTIDLIKNIQSLREISFSVLKIINRLLIVLSIENSNERLIEREPFIGEYLDFYGKLDNKGGLNYKEIEKIVRKADNVISDWYFELYRYNLLLGEIDYSDFDIMNIIDEEVLSNIEKLSEYENLLNDTTEVAFEGGQIEEEPVDMAIIRGEIKSIIALIEDVSRNMRNDYRKVRMKRLMGIIPVPQNFEKEVLHYIKSSIEFDNSPTRKLSFMHTVKKRMEFYKDLKNQKNFYEDLIKSVKDVI